VIARLPLTPADGADVAQWPDPSRAKRLADLLLEVARSVDRNVAARLPSSLDGDPRLEAVRNVLFEQERVTLGRLQGKLENPQQFAEEVSVALARAFEIAAARDEQLAKVLAPTLERATRASIRKDPDTLTGILYPLVGPVIRKSVAESVEGTLQRFNKALKHSLSLQGLKWRLEALRTGTSFADVVLKHTVEFRVEHVFLIHRKTGLLLQHVAADQVTAQDPQLVSGMLTAIQDFVRDSFEGGSQGGGIDTLRLGDLVLWCEEGPFAFLAAVIRGTPPETLHGVLRQTLTSIHEQYGDALEVFDGDDSGLGNLALPLEECLLQQETAQRPTRRLSRWLWAVPAVLAIAAAAWLVPRAMDANRFEAYIARLRAEPGVVVTDTWRRAGVWHVNGLRDPLAVDPAELVTDSELDPARVIGHWQHYQALDPAIAVKRLAASLRPPPSVELTVDGNVIRARGSAPEHWVEQARALIAAQPAGSAPVDLSALTDILDPTFNRLRDAIQAHVITFDSNAPRPAAGQDGTLDAVASELAQLIEVANGLGFSARVMIVGHTDSAGNETSNLALGQARAEVVRFMLRERGIAPDRLAVRSAGILEPALPGEDDVSAAQNRRITFTVGTSD
jgi:outer membrane protein OmpA-like peptidoglycan-associated protein